MSFGRFGTIKRTTKSSEKDQKTSVLGNGY